MKNVMIKKILFCICLLTSVSVSVSAKGPWKPLFAPDLSDAECDRTVWTVSDGVLTASEDQSIWSTKEYENFEIELEFKNDHETNSGVIVYCTNKKDWIPNSVEIQIADDYCDQWSKSPTNWQCGAVFGHLAADKQKVVREPGEWNTFKITCKGQSLTVTLNGKKVTKMDMSKWTDGKKNPDGSEIPSWLPTPFAKLPTKGYIGLQGKHGKATIWFRNVKIREI
jgi:hypothetical protein